ncbi:hypothetical protein COT47_02645 [Candidatus Woesearchaeota archaeon CG08_land_8_20_14_0_20_43_7]|nr:MAG: hypothetical protein COT47_02645 [Candidatus Woesearchaeota archaeon CG08_land_8_20_14_0_20_43_7]
MKSLIIMPFIMVMVLGFVMELNSIAEDASGKSIKFAEDMSNAIPCAAKGIPIGVCSPDLTSYDFTPEMERYMAALNEMNKTTSPIRDALQNEIEAHGEVRVDCSYDKDIQKIVCDLE